MQQPQIPDIGTLEYRVRSIEQNVMQLQSELRLYVPASVNDLQLQSIRTTVERIQNDVKDAKEQVSHLSLQLSTQVTGLSTQLSNQAKEQDQLQIRGLKWFAVTVVGILAALLVAYLTHLIH